MESEVLNADPNNLASTGAVDHATLGSHNIRQAEADIVAVSQAGVKARQIKSLLQDDVDGPRSQIVAKDIYNARQRLRATELAAERPFTLS